MKTCTQCKLDKEESEFYRVRSDSLKTISRCKNCLVAYGKEYYQRNKDRRSKWSAGWYRRNREQHLANTARWAAENADKRRLYTQEFKCRQRGLTLVAFEKMVEVQQNRCAICRQPEKVARALAIDHDHETGAVRGLLCGRCNTAIGMMEDSPALLLDAVQYLDAHRPPHLKLA